MRINCHSQLRNEVYYEKLSLLRTIERDKKLYVTFKESTIRETFKVLRYDGPCNCPL